MPTSRSSSPCLDPRARVGCRRPGPGAGGRGEDLGSPSPYLLPRPRLDKDPRPPARTVPHLPRARPCQDHPPAIQDSPQVLHLPWPRPLRNHPFPRTGSVSHDPPHRPSPQDAGPVAPPEHQKAPPPARGASAARGRRRDPPRAPARQPRPRPRWVRSREGRGGRGGQREGGGRPTPHPHCPPQRPRWASRTARLGRNTRSG